MLPSEPPRSAAAFTPPGAKSGIDALVERYAGMKQEISAIRATASSPDRTVTVVAGPGGAVLDVRLTDQAMRGSAQALGGSIMSALRLAVADGARQQAAIVQKYVGDRMNIVDRVMATQQEILGDKIKAGEEEQERLRAQPRHAAAEEGYLLVADRRPPAPSWQPPQQRPPRPQRPHETGDDEGFTGLRGRGQR